MNKAVLIGSEDWEGLFVNGELVKEGHTLNEGNSRVKYFNKLAKLYDFNIQDLQEGYVTDEYYDDYLSVYGGYPKLLNEVKYTLE